MKSKIAAETKITKIDVNDFHAKFLISIISQIPNIAKTVNNSTDKASKIEIPFLNIVFSLIRLITKFNNKDTVLEF